MSRTLVCVALLLLLPATAAAGPWSPPEQQVIQANLGVAPGAVDATGRAVFALEPLTTAGRGEQGFDVISFGPVGAFGPLQRIFEGPASSHVMAAGPGGDVVAAWTTDNQDPGWLRQEAVVAFGGADGRWSAPQQIDDGHREDPSEYRPLRKSKYGLSVAVGRDGGAVMTWVDHIGDWYAPWVVKASVRPPGGVFGPAQTVGNGDSDGWPQAAVDPEGGAVVIWPADGAVHVARRGAADAGFSSPVAISHPSRPADTNRYAFDVAQGPRGDLAVVFGSSGGAEVAVQRAGTTTFDEPEVVFNRSDSLPLAVDRAGNVITAWALGGPAAHPAQTGRRRVYVAVRPAGGRFTTTEVPGTNADDYGPVSAGFDAGDRAVIAWPRGDFDRGLMLAARAKPGGGFGMPEVVADRERAYTSELLFDSSGNGLLAWLEPIDGRVTRLRVARYDGEAADTPPPAAKSLSAGLDGRRVRIRLRVAGDVRMAVSLRRHGARVAGTGWRRVKPGLRSFALLAPQRLGGLRAVVEMRDRLGRRARASVSVRQVPLP